LCHPKVIVVSRHGEAAPHQQFALLLVREAGVSRCDKVSTRHEDFATDMGKAHRPAFVKTGEQLALPHKIPFMCGHMVALTHYAKPLIQKTSHITA
jgi:hypothetical protein